MAKHPELVRIGENLRRYRKQRQLTQAKLAELASASVEFIGGIERATIAPSISSLSRIAGVLGLRLMDLVAVQPTGADDFETSLNGLIDDLKSNPKVSDVQFLQSVLSGLRERDTATE